MGLITKLAGMQTNINTVISFFCIIFICVLGNTALIAAESTEAQVAKLLQASEAPPGVVFEIANRDREFLNWAMPEALKFTRQLKTKFPGLDIAVVSHGSEQFALTRKALASNHALAGSVQSLVDDKVNLHVCGTLAARRNVDSKEFSNIVDVAAAGPAQINDYVNLGYIRIRIKR